MDSLEPTALEPNKTWYVKEQNFQNISGRFGGRGNRCLWVTKQDQYYVQQGHRQLTNALYG